MKKGIFWIAVISLASVIGFFSVRSASAQGEQPQTPSDDQVNAVAKKLYCPVCPNTPLDVCETKACQDWRAQIRQELTSGWSEQQITDYFVQQYGQRVLGEPQRSGFTSMVWVLPVIGVFLGGGAVLQIVRSWKRRAKALRPIPATPIQTSISAEAQNQVEKALKELD